MPTNPRKQNGDSWLRGLWPVALVIAAAIAGAYFWFSGEDKPPQPAPSKFGGGLVGADECQQVTIQLNEAVGYLESLQFQKADESLSALARKFPKEPAAVRNLAICRVLAFGEPRLDGSRNDPETSRTAIEACQQLEPDSAVAHLLSAQIAIHLQDTGAAVAELELAAKLAPTDPTIWYKLYDTGRATNDDELRNISRRALTAAHQADPTNAYLLKELLVAQARDSAPQAAETVGLLLTQIEPILALVKQNSRADVALVAEQLKTAVAEQKWPQVVIRAQSINNVISSEEWVKSDLRRLNRHLLAYAVLDYSSAVCGETVPVVAVNTARIPVQLQAVPQAGQFPEIAGVKALNLSDFDLDGAVDVLVLTEQELAVFARPATGEAWGKSTAVAVREPMRGLLVADLDRDFHAKVKPGVPVPERDEAPEEVPAAKLACHSADVEVVVFGPAGIQIFRNDVDDDGKRTLFPVEQNAEWEGLRNVLAGVLADIDHDGDLDLVISTEVGLSIWLNQGQLKFDEATQRSSLPPKELAATSLVAVDWDRDLDIDILVSGPNDTPAGWLENLRHGSLRWRNFESELGQLSGSECLNVLDADGNASWDVAGAGPRGLRLARTRTDAPGAVRPLDFAEISAEGFARSLAGDFDNDTHPDLVAWNERGIKVFWGTGTARFTPAGGVINPAVPNAVAVAAADMDGDGDLDLVIARSDGLTLYDNEGGNKNHWLAVRVQGEEKDNKNTGDVNHLGIGSVLELKSGRQYQAQVVAGQVTHFGLGKQTSADVLRVIWTNGVPQPVVNPQAGTSICREHVIGSSCPYFYTWNGTRFEFCTDACWAAPLGLQLAEGVFAEPRAWEYLTVPGDKLKPKDGHYVIQMTEELWEATYLDRMELIAVDHPAEVSIFSNEKVGPPELAEFKIHTVRNRRLPIAARDRQGRSVLAQVAREDGDFMKGFDAPPRHGITDEHYLELDLGALENPQKLTLFLTGWLYPATTSLRVGLSQDRSATPPRPPALEVPDKDGAWQVVRPFMGFPGGRTKTIAVDLSGVFLADDYRLRIVTNLEFYWDAAFFSVDEEPERLEQTPLPVASADLHYRGFSTIIPNPEFGPPAYDYQRVNKAPRWAPMAGRLTRYGDVTELLQHDDDFQVIFGSGDEITVAFRVPEKEPPPGWKRDFLLHNVGWDKDNDLNVVYSQAVEPLPFHGMSGYPYRADEQYPDTPRHREYLRKYQTRTQTPMDFWRQIYEHAPNRADDAVRATSGKR